MKGADGQAAQVCVAQQGLEPLLHLVGRLVGKGHGHDPPGRDSGLLDQVRHAIGEHARLAGPRPGEDQHRPLRIDHCLPLRRVEAT